MGGVSLEPSRFQLAPSVQASHLATHETFLLTRQCREAGDDRVVPSRRARQARSLTRPRPRAWSGQWGKTGNLFTLEDRDGVLAWLSCAQGIQMGCVDIALEDIEGRPEEINHLPGRNLAHPCPNVVGT